MFSIGKIKIFTYGLFLFAGFLTSLWLALKRRNQTEEQHIYNISLIALITGLMGARLAYIILNPENFNTLLDYIAVWHGGLTFLGGLIFAILATGMYIKRQNLNFWKIADIFSVPLLLGIAITRIGGFLAGVNPGLQTELPWAVQGTHPAALYYVLANFIILFILLRVEGKRFSGYTSLLALALYGFSRFFLDFFRTFSGTVLIASRVAPLLLVLFAVIMIRIRKANVKVKEKSEVNSET